MGGHMPGGHESSRRGDGCDYAELAADTACRSVPRSGILRPLGLLRSIPNPYM